jgi:hypothetical protein
MLLRISVYAYTIRLNHSWAVLASIPWDIPSKVDLNLPPKVEPLRICAPFVLRQSYVPPQM